jgi:hypothetical protein
MTTQLELHSAAEALGFDNVSVEPDGTIWLGSENDKTFLTESELETVKQKAIQLKGDKVKTREALLIKLNITPQELATLLG